MATSEERRGQIEAAIAGLEAQRSLLGAAVVDPALAALREQLAGLSAALSAAASRQPTLASEGERKIVTVVFADISGFTALAERLDPEAVRNLMNSCFEHLVPVIEKYEGTVDKFVGDAVMALFGAPLAHENDAERALRASLEMLEALAKFNAEHRLDLGLHFGINTGEVIAGEIGSQGRRDYSVMGDAVNLAARLEDVSQRGEILVGPDTHRMTAALFEFETLPTITLKGKSEPIVVHRLSGLRSTPATTRGIRGLRSPLVGRDVELARLGVVLRSLRDGTGGVVAVTGEAGLGKSRLIAELRQSEGRGITWAEGRALSHTTRMSYWTARDILISLLELTPDTPPHDIKLILRGGVRQILPEKADEVYAYLATFMGLPEDEVIAGHTSYLAGGVLKKRIREAFRDYVAARASERPLAVVWEDLHWADSSSLDLLREVLPLGGRMPCLLILAFRPEGSINQILDVSIPPSTPKYEVVKLEPLHRLECESLVQNLLKIENLHDTTLKLILDRAEGNPFYLEELLRALIDANAVVVRDGHAFATRPIEQMDIPNTLQGVLMARIDRLPLESKQALQTASVIGRVFQLKVLERLYSTPTAGDGLHAHLDVLERREFVHPRNGPEIAQGLAAQEYIFKHVVTQSVAYNCLLIARRKQIHRAAGEAMEALFPERIGELAVTLAHHFEMAGAVDRALHYLALAAERAKNIYSNTEAIALYEKAIDQVNKLLGKDSGAAGKWDEVAAQLHVGLGDVLELTGKHDEALGSYRSGLRYAGVQDQVLKARIQRKIGLTKVSQRKSVEAVEAYSAAEKYLGEAPKLRAADWWREWVEIQLDRMWAYYWLGDIQEMGEVAEKTKKVIQEVGTPSQVAKFSYYSVLLDYRRERYSIRGHTLALAQQALEAAQKCEDLNQISHAQFGVGFCHLWRNELDEAEAGLCTALGLAERTGSVEYQVLCLTYLTVLYRKRGLIEGVRRYASLSMAAAHSGGMPIYVGAAKANLAWSELREGNPGEAEKQAQEALGHWAGVQYPIKWLALLPLISVMCESQRLPEAIQYARELIHPSQQNLSEKLDSLIKTGVEAWEQGGVDDADKILREVEQAAKKLSYL